MSVVQNPITGRSRGKFSNAIFSKWKGLNTLRSKPISVNQPNTTAQLSRRFMFYKAVSYGRSILPILRSSLKSLAVNISEFNAFISRNIPYIDPISGKFITAALSSLSFASGALPGFMSLVGSAAAGHAILVSWDPTYLSNLRGATDLVLFFTYNATTDTLKYHAQGEQYDTGSDTISDAGVAGDSVSIFIATCDVDYVDFSNSTFVGTFTLLA